MTQRSGLRIIAAQLLIHNLSVLHGQVGGACQTAKQKLKHDLKPPAHLYSASQPGARKTFSAFFIPQPAETTLFLPCQPKLFN